MKNKTAIIVGAGPAGLTAAYELIKRTDITPVVYEMTDKIGGICRTEDYKGNKIDIGGHRFFTKHKKILDWWFNILPLQGTSASTDSMRPDQKGLFVLSPDAPDPETTDRVMLIRQRRSRILFRNRFFDYPISLSPQVLTGLGLGTSLAVLISYLKAKVFPVRPERTLENFFINRFGHRLYTIFFKDYTEKLWGLPCRDISSDWGIQRVKGLSVFRTILHAIKKTINPGRMNAENTATSLIDQFLYPKFGPGQMWTTVADAIQAHGGQIFLNHKVTGISASSNTIIEIAVEHCPTNQITHIDGDYFISTMPVQTLIKAFNGPVPPQVRATADTLRYRDLIIAGLLFKTLKLKNENDASAIIPDCWLYIQDKHVRVGRIQIVNNWNPYMVARQDTVWMGLEICCSQKDDIWRLPDETIIASVVAEIVKLDIVRQEDLLDGVIVRQPKAYPVYTGAYYQLDLIREFTDSFHNLFLIGRNGMHRYNNMDHSMLTAIKAVDNIIAGETSKADIWNINVEDDYHEIK